METIAHYLAAHYLNPDVSFILDIGGQDMKAIFVNNGVIDRIETMKPVRRGVARLSRHLLVHWDILWRTFPMLLVCLVLLVIWEPDVRYL